MQYQEINIPGDTPGISWSVPVLQFKGSEPDAPKAYLQGALHADELPGPAVLHFLCHLLQAAETANNIIGDITIVPQANPIGLAQMPNQQLQGRFNVVDGTNFNRDFQRIALKDREQLLLNIDRQTPVNKLKNNLLYLALSADIVVDLHCDYESLLYTYVCKEFWPDASDFATTMKLHTVFIADGKSTAFDEAVSYAFRTDDNPASPRRLATTLELRGQRDVDETLAKTDAAGLMDFLIARGVVSGTKANLAEWQGKAVPLDNIEVVKSPVPGTVLLNKQLGDDVKTGDLLATVIHKPGLEEGTIHITAPQDGTIITRTNSRFAARGGQLFKIICEQPSTVTRKPGTLES